MPQLVFKWSQDGSNHPRFDEKELLRLPVPRALVQQASDYVEAVRAVISKRERAAQLLDAAKRAVEIAIEQDEKSALAYLEIQAGAEVDCLPQDDVRAAMRQDKTDLVPKFAVAVWP